MKTFKLITYLLVVLSTFSSYAYNSRDHKSIYSLYNDGFVLQAEVTKKAGIRIDPPKEFSSGTGQSMVPIFSEEVRLSKRTGRKKVTFYWLCSVILHDPVDRPSIIKKHTRFNLLDLDYEPYATHNSHKYTLSTRRGHENINRVEVQLFVTGLNEHQKYWDLGKRSTLTPKKLRQVCPGLKFRYAQGGLQEL